MNTNYNSIEVGEKFISSRNIYEILKKSENSHFGFLKRIKAPSKTSKKFIGDKYG